MVYLDYGATTPIKPEVVEVMMPYFKGHFGNPSSLHSVGKVAKEAVDISRSTISKILGCKSKELIFTSGATESNNMIIKGLAGKAIKQGKNHIISSKYEHHAVLNTLEQLKDFGFEITLVDVKDGIINCEDIEKVIKPATFLCTIMAVNNEIGSVIDLDEIGKICHKHGVVFHTDATQYIGHINKKISLDNVDSFSFSGHKFNAPKGIGGLYINSKLDVYPLLCGGQQERGMRAGTENVPYIVGMAKALELARPASSVLMKYLTDELKTIPGVKINGEKAKRCSSIINVSIDGVKGESLMYALDQYGIAVSTGSACNSDSDGPSHVLKAIGCSDEEANNSLRISISDLTTAKEISYTIETIKTLVALIRS